MRRASLLIVLMTGFVSQIVAEDDQPAYTRPQNAGRDFTIQGEYVGLLGDGHRWGAQIVALGDGQFLTVGLPGGLPGQGSSAHAERHEVKGQIIDDTAVFEGDRFRLRVRDGVMKVESLEGEPHGELTRVERKSPTLGAKPPAGAKMLFDGSSLDQWNNGEIVEGNLLGATDADTKLKLHDHSLHIEFRTPYMPRSRGQGRGNSGVYVQGRYELQVLDSFGLEPKDNECGGIYGIKSPDVNMCFPPLSWQTYDIDFTAARYEGDQKVNNARITVRHNGVLIHNDVELVRGTPGRSPEGAEPESLFLQDHRNPVAYRNIWVIER